MATTVGPSYWKHEWRYPVGKGNCTITLYKNLSSGYHSQHEPGHRGCRRARPLSSSIQVLSNPSLHKTKNSESEVYPNANLNHGIHVACCQSELWLQLKNPRNVICNWVMTRLFKCLTTRLWLFFRGYLGKKELRTKAYSLEPFP